MLLKAALLAGLALLATARNQSCTPLGEVKDGEPHSCATWLNTECPCGDICTMPSGSKGICMEDGKCSMNKKIPECTSCCEKVCPCGEACTMPPDKDQVGAVMGTCMEDGKCSLKEIVPDCTPCPCGDECTVSCGRGGCVPGTHTAISCGRGGCVPGMCQADGKCSGDLLKPLVCPKVTCPLGRPTPGDSCQLDREIETCHYDINCCPNTDTCAFTSWATCEDDPETLGHERFWSIAMARMFCESPPVHVCPENAPRFGDSCPGKMTCNYDRVCCPGSDKDCHFTTFATCNADLYGVWEVAQAGIYCEEHSKPCPTEVPEAGSLCSMETNGGNSCDYKEDCCPFTTDCMMTRKAICDVDDTWTIKQSIPPPNRCRTIDAGVDTTVKMVSCDTFKSAYTTGECCNIDNKKGKTVDLFLPNSNIPHTCASTQAAFQDNECCPKKTMAPLCPCGEPCVTTGGVDGGGRRVEAGLAGVCQKDGMTCAINKQKPQCLDCPYFLSTLQPCAANEGCEATERELARGDGTQVCNEPGAKVACVHYFLDPSTLLSQSDSNHMCEMLTVPITGSGVDGATGIDSLCAVDEDDAALWLRILDEDEDDGEGEVAPEHNNARRHEGMTCDEALATYSNYINPNFNPIRG